MLITSDRRTYPLRCFACSGDACIHQGKIGNVKVPDNYRDFGMACCSLFAMIDALDFTTDWRP